MAKMNHTRHRNVWYLVLWVSRCGEFIYDIVYMIGGRGHMLRSRSRIIKIFASLKRKTSLSSCTFLPQIRGKTYLASQL